KDNRTWKITPVLLQAEGVPPAKFLPWLYDLIQEIREQKLIFVGHNGINYDAQMLKSHFEKYLGKPFDFGPDEIFDTGAVEKASQMINDPKVIPKPGETLYDYFRRICY